MQEIMQYTTYGIALIGGLAFLVAIIVQVLKELPKLKKIPTSVVALVVSLILCPVTLIALCTWYAVKITWYYVMAALLGAFPVYLVATGGWEAIIIQNLRGMSTGGDSRDVRGSHGVLFISSGNW